MLINTIDDEYHIVDFKLITDEHASFVISSQ